MKIVINSHIQNNIAVEHLLESMRKQKEFNDFEIIIMIGGYYDIIDYEINKINNITYIKCNHNSIDFTGLITLSEIYNNNIDEYYLYLHDTCKVGDKFYTKLKSIDLTNISSIKINKKNSMNIGIYSQKIINTFKDFLSTKKNTCDNKRMEFKANHNEDYIFDNDKNNIVLDNYDGWIHTAPVDYYGKGTMRIVEHYPNLDLYKIKANYGAAWQLTL